MLKKIPLSQLRPGMFVHEVERAWPSAAEVPAHCTLADEGVLATPHKAEVARVVIDTSKGLDLVGAPSIAEAAAVAEREVVSLAHAPVAAPAMRFREEVAAAREVQRQALAVVKILLLEARLRRNLGTQRLAPVVDAMMASILRNPGALVALSLVKSKSDQLFEHSVAAGALLVAFCRSRGLDADTMYQAGVGGLVHDIGSAFVPDSILNKRGVRSEEEQEVFMRHPSDGHRLLSGLPDVGRVALDITLHHHERWSGGGYPSGAPGAELSDLAQMAAIVDTYTSLTTDASAGQGVAPAQALRNMYQMGEAHFNLALLQEFIRMVGLYPVGTLIMLESRRLAVVVEPHATNLLTPRVIVFFDTRTDSFLKPSTLDLARPAGHGGGDRILGPESPAKWRVAPLSIAALA